MLLPVAKDDDGGDEGVLGVVDLHLAHVAAEAEEGLVGEAGLDVVVLGEGVVGGVDDGVALRVVPPGAPQHHHLRRAALQQTHLKQEGYMSEWVWARYLWWYLCTFYKRK